MKIEELKLSTRTQNILFRKGIMTTEKLLHLESRELVALRSLGPKGRAEIFAKLEEQGINYDCLKEA